MTSDVDGKVIAIQGNPVDSTTLGTTQDGYDLTWENADGKWEAKPTVGLQSQIFTSNGTWTAPDNVCNIWLIGCGGGAGGQAGCGNSTNACGGAGGGGSLKTSSIVPVIPGMTYTITIGSGGTGGAGAMGFMTGGTDGINTTFGSLYTALGGGAAVNNGDVPDNFVMGGLNIPVSPNVSRESDSQFSMQQPGCGGCGANHSQSPTYGLPQEGFTGGGAGSSSSNGGGAGGGGAGAFGNGGNGGNGGSSPTNGTSVAANTGAGGGGGGGSTNNVNGGDGANGGSGQLIVSWIG